MTVATTTSKSGPYAGAGTTGPFTVTFPFLETSHLLVVQTDADGVETVLTLGDDYTVTGGGGSTGTVTTIVAVPSGETLTITRNVPATQEADYVDNDSFPAESHELALDKLTMICQQLKEEVDRSVKLPVSSTEDVDTLNAALIRVSESADNIDTVAGISANVTTVAGISSNVTTVAGISADVTSVAGISANVTSVAGNATNINTVAGLDTEITALGAISADISAVAAIDSDVSAVAADATDIGAVAAISTEVGTVAGISADVAAVAAVDSDVTTVAGIASDVTTVATNIADVQTVADALGTPLSAANAVSYDNGTSGLTATNVQTAVDELAAEKLDKTGGTAANVTLEGSITEEVFAITDGASVDINPANGSIQTWTLGANRTPTATNFAAGQSVTLMIDDGTARTITWTTIGVTWKTDGGVAPTLNTTGFTVIELWKVGSTVYGARVGDA